MSERTPLLSGSVNGPSTASLPSRGDVERALPSKESRIKVSEAAGALSAGKLPLVQQPIIVVVADVFGRSQSQISKALQVVLESDVLKATGGPNSRTARVGAEGQRVLENAKGVLRAFKEWGEAKNGDDLIQNFFVSILGSFNDFELISQYNASTADVDVDVNTPNAPSQQELSRDAQRAIASFRTIASLLVTNSNFRKLASDVVILSRDIFADAASVAADQAKEAANQARPSESERQKGVDFGKAQQKGKEVSKGLQTGKLQAEARENIWDEVERVKEYMDEKLPEGEEARDRMVQKLQEVRNSHCYRCYLLTY